MRKLADSTRVRQSFVRHAFRFWMGRNETFDDSPTLIAADDAYTKNGGDEEPERALASFLDAIVAEILALPGVREAGRFACNALAQDQSKEQHAGAAQQAARSSRKRRRRQNQKQRRQPCAQPTEPSANDPMALDPPSGNPSSAVNFIACMVKCEECGRTRLRRNNGGRCWVGDG